MSCRLNAPDVAMQNPYESPSTISEVPLESRQFPFDVGNFAGRYLQLLAIVSIVWMLADWFLGNDVVFDFSFIFYIWGGFALRRHSQTARRWVVGISALVIAFCVGLTSKAILFGTDGVSLQLGREIENPTLVHVFLLAGILSAIAAIPLFLLLSRQAKVEFAKPIRASIDGR